MQDQQPIEADKVLIRYSTKMRSLFVSTLFLLLETSSGMLRRPLDRELPSPSMERARYSNYWAVEVNGGVMNANQLAAKHGFVNMGKVKLCDLATTAGCCVNKIIYGEREREGEVCVIPINVTLNLQVGNFNNHYHFQLLVSNSSTSVDDGSSYIKSVNYRLIHDQTIGSLAEIGLQPALTSRLKSENMVQSIKTIFLWCWLHRHRCRVSTYF